MGQGHEKNRIEMVRIFILCIGVLGLFSCTSDSALERVLKASGNNRQELERVLHHYSHDGQKYRAACFLIENMPGSYGVDSTSLERLEPVYEAYDSVNRSFGYRMEGVWGDWNGWGERIDSLAQSHFSLLETLPVVMDLSHVKADYLIREKIILSKDIEYAGWSESITETDPALAKECVCQGRFLRRLLRICSSLPSAERTGG